MFSAAAVACLARSTARRPGGHVARLAGWAAFALGAAASAQVQAQYRVVGPDGRVTYTDRPPTFEAVPAPRGSTASAGSELAALGAGLPFALRQVVERYPVRLYTSANCAPCDAARQALRHRGVPMLEYSVNRPEDLERYQRELAASELPAMTVGGQRHIGFGESEWQMTLEAAGYPATSQLPSSYRWVPVRPLAPERSASAGDRPASAPTAASRAANRPAAAPAPNPDGFRF